VHRALFAYRRWRMCTLQRNAFAAARDDKTAMRTFAKLLWTLVEMQHTTAAIYLSGRIVESGKDAWTIV